MLVGKEGKILLLQSEWIVLSCKYSLSVGVIYCLETNKHSHTAEEMEQREGSAQVKDHI